MFPPDCTPERCNTPYLAKQACEKEYELNVRTPFGFSAGKTCFMEGSPSFLFLIQYYLRFSQTPQRDKSSILAKP